MNIDLNETHDAFFEHYPTLFHSFLLSPYCDTCNSREPVSDPRSLLRRLAGWQDDVNDDYVYHDLIQQNAAWEQDSLSRVEIASAWKLISHEAPPSHLPHRQKRAFPATEHHFPSPPLLNIFAYCFLCASSLALRFCISDALSLLIPAS